MTTERCKLKPQWITAEFAATAANRDSRTVPMTFYNSATVLQVSFEQGLHQLRLSMDPAHVDMGLLTSGRAPFTRGHASENDPNATIGVIERAWLEGDKGKAVVRFSQRADVQPLYQDVLDGIQTQVSVGARLHRLKEITPSGEKGLRTFLATSWTPFAVALVGVAADPGAHFTASADVTNEVEIEFSANHGQGASMSEQTSITPAAAGAPAYEETATQIRKLVGIAKLSATVGEDLITGKATMDEARIAVFNALAARSAENPTIGHRFSGGGRDERDGLIEAMSEGLAVRFSGKEPSDRAREFVGAPLGALAYRICQVHGLRPRSMDPAESIRLAASTSDFPLLLQGTGNRILLTAYDQAASPIKQIARQSTATDFRAKLLLRLGEMPDLKKVPESGEITHGPRTEQKESYSLATFARMFSLTRQAIINDDLSAFQDYFAAFGAAAARLEGAELLALLAANSGLGADMDDLAPLFDATHNNLMGSGTAISVDSLGLARLTLRLQPGIDGTTILGITPKFLVVPPQKETLAEIYLATLSAGEAADVNPFSGKLTLVCIPGLSNVSATGWYLFADPNQIPILEWSYLASQPGPQIETRSGWDLLGAEFRCFMDHGCGIIGTRGAILNPGA